MALTIGELRASLAKLPDEHEVVISLGESVFGGTQRAYRVEETGLEWFEPTSEHEGLAFYLDGTDEANALCIRTIREGKMKLDDKQRTLTDLHTIQVALIDAQEYVELMLDEGGDDDEGILVQGIITAINAVEKIRARL